MTVRLRTTPLHRLRRRTAVLLATLVMATTVTTANATTDDGAPPPIAVEVLAGHAGFPDDVGVTFTRKLSGERREVIRVRDAGHLVVARITVQPGARFPWHTHPGPVVVSVVEGDLVYQQASDCVERGYTTGDAFLDPGTKVHTAWNPADAPTVLVATFSGVPDGGQVTLPTPEQPTSCDRTVANDRRVEPVGRDRVPGRTPHTGEVPGWSSVR
ncbi:cupin domain-containing protein [Isoptericola sp. AK164]|uniref:cupin domain-containing protein n=1 Tax=Isoptericola sp. AK164 TaxID=3024246 RepID=UPI002418A660|nr:cupin domain-containing protein [Isoptericola sp. AK164]